MPSSGHHIVRASKAAAATAGRVSPAAAMVTRTDRPKDSKRRWDGHRARTDPRNFLSKAEVVACGRQLAAMGLPSYRDYLRSAWWQHFSTIVATPYRNCHVCGRSGSALHHLDYSTLGRERPDDVVPLCEDHHEIVHRVHILERRPLALCHVVVRQRATEGALLIQPSSPAA